MSSMVALPTHQDASRELVRRRTGNGRDGTWQEHGQPLEHTAALVSRALNVDDERLPRSLASEAAAYAKKSIGSGWFGKTAFKGVAKLYPLHPMLLPVLVRFFARFGQNERSLFGFLLSNEPFGLQSFALRPLEAGTWYRIPDFFDYVRAVFGHRLAGESYRGSWLRLIELVDRVQDLSEIEIRIVKTVAILNLLDADDLAASNEVLSASVGNASETEIATVLAGLTKRGVLFKRGQAGGYRLWSASSVNLEAALNGARSSSLISRAIFLNGARVHRCLSVQARQSPGCDR
jgi:biotin operon repressor